MCQAKETEYIWFYIWFYILFTDYTLGINRIRLSGQLQRMGRHFFDTCHRLNFPTPPPPPCHATLVYGTADSNSSQDYL